MHPDADAFLDAIFASPDDDTHRLVYADWLEEYGQGSYPQFIRLQCAAAREPFWSDEANRLWEEIGRVWSRLDDEWWPATREGWGIPGVRSRWISTEQGWVDYPVVLSRQLDAIDFRRGFLRQDAAAHGEQLLSYGGRWPWFPGWRLKLFPDLYGFGEEIAELPCLQSVRQLSFESGTGHELHHLFRSPHLTRLQRLDLSAVMLASEWVEVLLGSPHLGALEEIHVLVNEHTNCAPETAVLELMGRFKRVVQHGQ